MNAENYSPLGTVEYRLRVVSNFGDGYCKAGEIHARSREISCRVASKFRPPYNRYRQN